MSSLTDLDDATPIIVGVGRVTQRPGQSVHDSLDPIGLMASALRRAVDDTDSANEVLAHIDAIATVHMLMEHRVPKKSRPLFPNPARSVATIVGATGCSRFYQTTSGGQSPQLAVNELAERISRGELQSAVIVGAEGLATFDKAVKQGYKIGLGKAGSKVLKWGDRPTGPPPEIIGYTMRWPLVTIPELIHGINTPTTIYALFEQAIRKSHGRTNQEHLAEISELFSGFSAVAARDNKNSWYPVHRTGPELSTCTSRNRVVTQPGYPKLLNAIMNVDMSAAVIVTSVGWARQHSIAQDKWVFIHGCGDAYDLPPLMRPQLDRSLGMQNSFRQAFNMTCLGTLQEVKHFDIYSCFPSAVQVAIREMSIPTSDGKELTLTGGLPYHGGPGNNYSAHGIVAMVETLRKNPGEWGMVTANGGFLTEHSVGFYSTTPFRGRWKRPDHNKVQVDLNEMMVENAYTVSTCPNGAAVVDSCVASPLTRGVWRAAYVEVFRYTVEHDAEGPSRLVVIGRLTTGSDQGQRFAAINTDEAVIKFMLETDHIIAGCTGNVSSEKISLGRGKQAVATFIPDGISIKKAKL